MSQRPELHGRGEPKTPIFVFGSNLAGRHGKGAALWALQNRGATRGVGVGRQGLSYAIPTKDDRLRPLPLDRIEAYARQFLAYARGRAHEQFELTPVGCGLAGFKPEQIAPFFLGAPANVLMPSEFLGVLYPGVAEIYPGWRGVTQPCDVCERPVAVNAISPSACFCSQECGMALYGHKEAP